MLLELTSIETRFLLVDSPMEKSTIKKKNIERTNHYGYPINFYRIKLRCFVF